MSNNTSTFLKDDEVRNFADLESMRVFLKDREKTDTWENTPANFLRILGVEDASTMVRTMGTAVLPSPIEGYKGTPEGLAETMSELGYLVSYFDENSQEWHTYPLRNTGWSSLWDRSKGGCRGTRCSPPINCL